MKLEHAVICSLAVAIGSTAQIDKDSMAKMNAPDVKALATKFGCSARE